ncbi:MAG: DUF5615 family PIN-like protein [Dysgonamonadaceae bacterium]|nr:DUF5615 family PIN-like protein [Dysgonamonadaceae bacterium]
MKLLFDQNISFRIVRSLPETFVESKHTRSVGLNDRDDADIWLFGDLLISIVA